MSHDILDVPSIPRQKPELQALLNEARYQRKHARMKRILTILVIIVAILLLFLHFSGILRTHGIALYLGGTL